MNEKENQLSFESQAEKLVYFPRADGSRVPFKVYSSPEIYQLEQERFFAAGLELPRHGSGDPAARGLQEHLRR